MRGKLAAIGARPGLPLAVKLAGIFSIVVVVQVVDAWFARGVGAMPVNAAVGVALAALLIAPTKRWPYYLATFFAAGVVAQLFSGGGVVAALSFAAADASAALVGAALYRRFAGERPQLDRTRDVLSLVGYGVVLGPGLVSLTAYAVSVVAGSSPLSTTWPLFFTGSSVAALALVPSILTWAEPAMRRHRYGHAPLWERLVFATALLLVAAYVFTGHSQFGFFDAYLIIPFLLWAALRFGVAGATDANVVVSLMGVGFTARGLGDFAISAASPVIVAVSVQAFLGATASMALIVASVFAERAAADLERNAALAEVRDHRARLEAEVTARTSELTATVEQLSVANGAKDRFLASMSHELRTPLNSIIGFSGVMLGGLTGDITEEQRRQLAMIARSGGHLLAIVSDVLDIARVEAGNARVARELVTALDLAREAAEVVAPLAEAKGLRLSVEGDDADLFTDGAKVRQALINLLGNAVKFTERGGVTVTVGDDGSSAYFVVSDTGSGFPEDAAEAIMGEFVQLEAPDGMKPEGAGLGLAITRRFARLLGGDLSAEGEPGVGATFTLTVLKDVDRMPVGPHCASPEATAG